MNKQEAIEAMKEGKKVTHRFFGSDEWIKMDGYHSIETEEGYLIPTDEFWRYRCGPFWNADWSLLNSEPNDKRSVARDDAQRLEP